jgi:hypothetical protein
MRERSIQESYSQLPLLRRVVWLYPSRKQAQFHIQSRYSQIIPWLALTAKWRHEGRVAALVCARFPGSRRRDHLISGVDATFFSANCSASYTTF